MSKLPENLQRLAAKHNITSDEMWLVPGGKVHAIKHTAIERMAAAERIRFEIPTVLEGDGQGRTVALMGTAQLNDRVEWSIGEASPHNNKNAYPWAIAEKRLKGRLTLKLLCAYGDVYSEEEAEDFRQPVRQPTPMATSPRQSSNAIKKGQPEMWPEFERKMRACQTWDDLRDVWDSYSDKMPTWPQSWQESADAEYLKAEDSIRARAA